MALTDPEAAGVLGADVSCLQDGSGPSLLDPGGRVCSGDGDPRTEHRGFSARKGLLD